MEAARLSQWGKGFQLPRGGERLPSLDQVRSGMGAGQTIVRQFQLIVPVAGYYRVVASAIADSDDEITSNGALIQNAIHREVWVWITPEGGKVTSNFDESIFPLNARKRPGPLLINVDQISYPRAQPHDPLQNRTLMPSSSCDPSYVCGYVLFYNSDTATYDPVPHAYLYLDFYDIIYEHPAGGTSTETDAQGYYELNCGGSYYYEGFGKVQLLNSDVEIDAPNVASLSVDYSDCGTNDDITVSSSQKARVFTNFNIAIAASRSILSYNRGEILVDLEGSASNSSYNPNEDKITIRAAAGDDHIWGEFGVFVAAHEYGHAVHEEALGGINPNSDDNCDSHSVGAQSSYGCALAEGFADFHAVATRGDEGSFYTTIINRATGSVGPKVEGSVAAFFYDLIDGTTAGETSENHDETDYSGAYVAGSLATCNVALAFWQRASGVDHIIFCLENSLGHQQYFSGRLPPSDFDESVSEPGGWSASDIFKNWRWNIFDETQ